jgi:hypothetical protein
MRFIKLKQIIIFFLFATCILLLAGCNGAVTPPELDEAEKFVGYWVNEDEDTANITKVDITIAGDTIIIHMWGKCYPTDCDWGYETTDISDAADGILNITWDFDFATETQELIVLSDGRLNVAGFVDFPPDDIRHDYEYAEYFVKED